MAVHLRRSGEWMNCKRVSPGCRALLHQPEMTLAEAQDLNPAMLERLLTALYPPSETRGEVSCWLDDVGMIHRDFDLPAVIDIHGYRAWYRHGILHREGGKPTRVLQDGKMEWWDHGTLVRTSLG